MILEQLFSEVVQLLLVILCISSVLLLFVAVFAYPRPSGRHHLGYKRQEELGGIR